MKPDKTTDDISEGKLLKYLSDTLEEEDVTHGGIPLSLLPEPSAFVGSLSVKVKVGGQLPLGKENNESGKVLSACWLRTAAFMGLRFTRALYTTALQLFYFSFQMPRVQGRE